MPEPTEPRKAAARLWLLAPAILAAAALVGCGVGWFVAVRIVREAIGRQTQALRRAGWTVQAAPVRIGGFPLRLRIRLRAVRLHAPSGWGAEAERLDAQAYVYAPDHWVLSAPAGLTVERPDGVVVKVGGGPIRASLAGLQGAPWRVAVQVVAPRFTAAPGQAPPALASADLIEAYLRPSQDGRGEAQMLLRLEGGRGQGGGWIERLGGTGPVAAMAEVGLTRTATLSGSDPASAARAWAAAGGRVAMRQARLTSPAASLQVGAGMLSPGADGRLTGVLPATLRQSPAAVAALAGEAVLPTPRPGDAAALPLAFEGGRVKLGAIKLGPAPKLF